jgi:hypothetical protein
VAATGTSVAGAPGCAARTTSHCYQKATTILDAVGAAAHNARLGQREGCCPALPPGAATVEGCICVGSHTSSSSCSKKKKIGAKL